MSVQTAQRDSRPLPVSTTATISVASPSAGSFACATAGVVCLAAALAGCSPVAFSVVIVFLFAGPHLWFELRYFLSRLPSRLGPLRNFMIVSLAGAVTLAASYVGLTLLTRLGIIESETATLALGTWNTLVIAWASCLTIERSKQVPRRDWWLTMPFALTLIGLNWLSPACFGLAIVYAHPIVALCLLDRELRRKPDWRIAYRFTLALIPLALCLLYICLAKSAPLAVTDFVSWQVTRQAGAGILSDISSRLLVASHGFLEMLHYGVWMIGIPLVTGQIKNWQLVTVPTERRSPSWKAATQGILALSTFAVSLLWVGLMADYGTTRDVYFVLAMGHVLAEVPFILRAL